MSSSATPGALSGADRVGVVVLMGAGVILAAITVIGAVIRLSEALGGGAIEVMAEFAGTPAQAPIGVDGAPVTVGLDTAVLSVPDLPSASIAALAAQQLVLMTVVIVVTAMLVLLALGILRGVVFSKRHTVYVGTASVAGFLGISLYPFFGNMAANGAFAALSDGTFENVILTVQPLTFIVAAFVAALATTVFSVGARLQRETEGLV